MIKNIVMQELLYCECSCNWSFLNQKIWSKMQKTPSSTEIHNQILILLLKRGG